MRNASRHEQLAERLDNVGGLEPAGYADGQALAGELVDDAQHSERFAIVGAVSDEVVRPGMVGALRPQTDA